MDGVKSMASSLPSRCPATVTASTQREAALWFSSRITRSIYCQISGVWSSFALHQLNRALFQLCPQLFPDLSLTNYEILSDFTLFTLLRQVSFYQIARLKICRYLGKFDLCPAWRSWHNTRFCMMEHSKNQTNIDMHTSLNTFCLALSCIVFMMLDCIQLGMSFMPRHRQTHQSMCLACPEHSCLMPYHPK